MLRITADVNGKVIGHLFIHNTSRKHGEAHVYDAAFWQDGHDDGVFGIEGIRHPRPEGWAALVARVLRRCKVVND